VPNPDYDKLLQVEGWVTDEKSPVYKALQEAMQPYEQKMQAKAQSLAQKQGKPLTEEQKATLLNEYKQVGAAKTLELLGQQFGGKIPPQEEAQKFDWNRRAQQLVQSGEFKGTPEEALATVKEGQPPYSRAYGTISMLQSMLPKEPPVAKQQISRVEVNSSEQPPQEQPAMTLTPPDENATDAQKLAEAKLMLLYQLANEKTPIKLAPAAEAPTSPAAADPTSQKIDENLRRLMEYGR
jgi:hypothetical protein